MNSAIFPVGIIMSLLYKSREQGSSVKRISKKRSVLVSSSITPPCYPEAKNKRH